MHHQPKPPIYHLHCGESRWLATPRHHRYRSVPGDRWLRLGPLPLLGGPFPNRTSRCFGFVPTKKHKFGERHFLDFCSDFMDVSEEMGINDQWIPVDPAVAPVEVGSFYPNTGDIVHRISKATTFVASLCLLSGWNICIIYLHIYTVYIYIQCIYIHCIYIHIQIWCCLFHGKIRQSMIAP